MYQIHQDEFINKKVNVWFPHYCRIERILKEDSNGLYVKYQNQRCSVRPHKNHLGENIYKSYIGTHPKLAKLLGR